jgi:hypothetical protein
VIPRHRPLTSWCIWYDDRPPYTSKDGCPEGAPVDGVQHVKQVVKGRVELLTKREQYVWDGTQWIGPQRVLHPVLERLLRERCPEVKFGRLMDTEDYYNLRVEAIEGWPHGSE